MSLKQIAFALSVALWVGACSGEDFLTEPQQPNLPQHQGELPKISTSLTARMLAQSQQSRDELVSLSSEKTTLKGVKPDATLPGEIIFGGEFTPSKGDGSSRMGQDAQPGSSDEVNLADMLGISEDPLFETEIFVPNVEEELSTPPLKKPVYSYEQAAEVYTHGDKAKGVMMLDALHQQGNAKASHDLGVHYYNRGETDDEAPKLARMYLDAAADVEDYQGNGGALYHLALLEVRERNYAEGLSLATVAGEQRGDGRAWALINQLLKSKEGFDPEDERQTSSIWFKRGMKNGQLGPFYHLYYVNHQHEMDDKQSQQILETIRLQYLLGASKGLIYQQYCLALAYYEGKIFPRNPTNLKKAYQLADRVHREVYSNQRLYARKHSAKFITDAAELWTALDAVTR